MSSPFIFTRHKLTRYVADFLKHTNGNFKVLSEYDFGFSKQYIYGYNFQKHVNNPKIVNNLSFSQNELASIIQRCRLLRSFDLETAIKYVAAAETACIDFIDAENPKFLLAPRIDTFFLDVLERKLHHRGSRYIGVWRSAFVKNQFFLTNRGELHELNSPSDDDIESLITNIGNIDFRATSLLNLTGFSRKNFFLNHYNRIIRDLSLEAIRITGKIHCGYRELATGVHVNEYKIPLNTWKGNFTNDEDIRAILKSNNPKVFIALQVNPESTIDYYSPNLEFININSTLLHCVRSFLSQGYYVIIKDHPNMFGRRNFKFLNVLSVLDGVYLASYSISSNEIISSSNLVFTWSGTVAIQAYFSGIPSLSICSPFGMKLSGFVITDSYTDMSNKIAEFNSSRNVIPITYEDKRRLSHNILKSHVEGQVFTLDRVQPDAKNFSSWIDSNILNT